MKKLLVILAASALLLCLCASALASVDMTYFNEHTNIFNIDSNNFTGNAFIKANFSTEQVTVAHRYSLAETPSVLYGDILVGNYGSENAYACMRMWLEYIAEKPLNITSVTLEMGEKSYDFTDVTFKDSVVEKDGYVDEHCRVIFGKDNVSFLSDIADFLGTDYDAAVLKTAKMILHGDEDVTAVVPGAALMNVEFVGICMLKIAPSDLAAETAQTPMTVR